MTKELSKQLCELCGIKPKEVFTLGASTKTHTELIPKETSPDFEEPENFVKLLEIMFKFPMSFKEYKTFKESVIQGCLKEVETNEQLKQSIKEAEWKYE